MISFTDKVRENGYCQSISITPHVNTGVEVELKEEKIDGTEPYEIQFIIRSKRSVQEAIIVLEQFLKGGIYEP